MIQLVCLDMAGTTVEDGGAVLAAFHAALPAAGVPRDTAEYDKAVRYALDTMGQSKIDVFRAIAGGDEERAHAGNDAFEAAYAASVSRDGVQPVKGAEQALGELRDAGRRIVLTTGFSPATRDAVLGALGWHKLVTAALSPADAGRGRPFPDMLLSAVLRTGTDSVAQLAVAGDTVSDLLAGHRAGASVIAGVRTGTHTEADFATVPHTHVLDSVAELPRVLVEADERSAS